tara:strand:- start:1329 stop:2096 length:768 start_codon:yes stop_codon:yes gene_type:complete
MQYLTPQLTQEVIGRLKTFENELCEVFSRYGYDLRDNLGRRNQLVSQAQEKEFARSLRKVYKEVVEDGAPGKPDIFIVDIQKELECKLTSGSGKSKTFSLQTDWETLKNKGSLDYLYMLTTPDFEGFCVLFFKGLTTDDFYPPASGSRGKSRMNKAKAMKKCQALHGRFVNKRKIMIQKWAIRKGVAEIEKNQKIAALRKELSETENNKRRQKLMEIMVTESRRYHKKMEYYQTKVNLWEGKEDSFTFRFEGVKS